MPTSAPLTRQIAEIVVTTPDSAVPEDSVRSAKHGLLDWYAVTLAGLDEPLSRILRDTYGTGGEASIIGTGLKASPHDAALVNGATSHALDYDDVIPFVGHPTPPLMPALLAVAEVENKSGHDVLMAYISGFEAACLVGAQAMPSHYTRGFHSTGTIGAFGAAAGVSKLLGLSVEETEMALGLAGAQAAGLKSMFGTMTKPFHAGKAAANGVMAAVLAAKGFTANPRVLEVEQGFFSTQTDTAPEDISGYDYGKFIQQNQYKFHAACYLTHSAINGLGALKKEADLVPDIIEGIALKVPEAHLAVCNIQEPETGLETKFSLRHCAAYAVAGYDTSAITTYSDENANVAGLVDLRRKVSVDGSLPPGLQTDITVQLKSGETLNRVEDVAAVVRTRDQEQEALTSKFVSLTSPVVGSRAEDMANHILSFETSGSVNELVSLGA